MKSKFKVKGIDCANCASKIESVIQKLDGVESVNIGFLTQKMELEYDEDRKAQIIENVKKVIKKEEPDAIIEEI